MTGDFLNQLKASEGKDTIVDSIGDVLERQVRAWVTQEKNWTNSVNYTWDEYIDGVLLFYSKYWLKMYAKAEFISKWTNALAFLLNV